MDADVFLRVFPVGTAVTRCICFFILFVVYTKLFWLTPHKYRKIEAWGHHWNYSKNTKKTHAFHSYSNWGECGFWPTFARKPLRPTNFFWDQRHRQNPSWRVSLSLEMQTCPGCTLHIFLISWKIRGGLQVIQSWEALRGLPRGLRGKESACQWTRHRRRGLRPRVRKLPGGGSGTHSSILSRRTAWTEAGYGPSGQKESDTTEHTCTTGEAPDAFHVLGVWEVQAGCLPLLRTHTASVAATLVLAQKQPAVLPGLTSGARHSHLLGIPNKPLNRALPQFPHAEHEDNSI